MTATEAKHVALAIGYLRVALASAEAGFTVPARRQAKDALDHLTLASVAAEGTIKTKPRSFLGAACR